MSQARIFGQKRNLVSLRALPKQRGRIGRMVEPPIEWFDSCASALAFMVCLFVVTAVFYIWAHIQDGFSAHERRRAMIERAVRLSVDGFSTPSYDDALLERWYGRGEVAALKSRIKDKTVIVAQQNAQERRQVVAQMRDLALRGISDAGPLGHLPLPSTAKPAVRVSATSPNNLPSL
jgi:hypothetical protein